MIGPGSFPTTMGYAVSAALMGGACALGTYLALSFRARQQEAERMKLVVSPIPKSGFQRFTAQWLHRAGLPEDSSLGGFGLGAALGFMIPLVYGWGLGSALGGAVLGFLAYLGILRDRWLRKVKQAESQVSGFLDLLSVSIQAGSSLDGALATARATLAEGLLSKELSRALNEIQIGRTRAQALDDLSRRVPVAALRQCVISIHQSESTGSPLAQVLADQAQAARALRLHAMEEEAHKLPVKLLFPLLVFIFPITLVIVLAPILLRLTEGS